MRFAGFLWSLAWRSVAVAIGCALLGVSIACCLLPSTPTVSCFKTQDFRPDWFGDGPPVKVAVYNPLDVTVEVEVECAPDGAGRFPHFWVDVAPGKEVDVLAEVLNKHLVGNPCWRKSWRKK